MKMSWGIGGISLPGKTEVVEQKSVPWPLRPPRTLDGHSQVPTGASAVRDRRLTTWVMAPP